MQKIFHNILMPAVFTRKTDATIKTAIDFANHLGCHLHLLFVDRRSFFSFDGSQEFKAKKQKEIQQLRNRCHQEMRRGLKLFISGSEVNPKNSIHEYTEANEIDLVLTNEELDHLFFANGDFKSVCNISCPVLTIKSHSDIRQLKTIVLPISNFLPINKIRVAVYLAIHFDASIHLVALEKKDSLNEGIGYLKRTFQLIKETTGISVACAVIKGKNLSDIAGQYAYQVNAGLIVMNPEDDAGFITRFVSKLITRESEVPVITVA